MYFDWLNNDSRTFLSRGYLGEDQSAEDRILEIAKTAERILNIEGFADKFYEYMAKGFYSLSSPVWSNFGNNRGYQ
jgi:ribonucleoside-diphosphate reductase alpha chain